MIWLTSPSAHIAISAGIRAADIVLPKGRVISSDKNGQTAKIAIGDQAMSCVSASGRRLKRKRRRRSHRCRPYITIEDCLFVNLLSFALPCPAHKAAQLASL